MEDHTKKAEYALALIFLARDPGLSDHVGRVLALMKGFEELDLSEVEPLISPLPGQTPLREDVPGKPLSRSEALADAPDTQAGFFRTSKP